MFHIQLIHHFFDTAVPYHVKGMPQKKLVLQGDTEYSGQFMMKRECYSSMPNKPLCAYDPLAFRSRNRTCPKQTITKAFSSVKFDDGLFFCKKRQFVTSHHNSYTGLPVDPLSNSGILAEKYALMVAVNAK